MLQYGNAEVKLWNSIVSRKGDNANGEKYDMK